MDNLPISDYVKNYYREHNIVLDDFTQATIIWIFHTCWEEQLSMLRGIADTTTDEALKLQIKERVAFELQKKTEFMENHDGKYIYGVTEDDNGFGASYFTTVKQALEYGKSNCESGIRIDKYLINPISDKHYEEVRTCIWDESGSTILSLNPFFYGDFKQPEENYGRADRFEEAFINCEFPFERGDIVRHVINGTIGVLETSKEDRARMLRQAELGELSLDASDVVVSVDYIGDDGTVYYDHFSFLNLEKVTEFESKEQEDLMRSISALLQGKEMLWSYTYYLQQYVNSR